MESNIDRIKRIALSNEEKAHLLMQQLTKTTQDLEELEWNKKEIQKARVDLIVKLRLLDVSLSTIANLAGISRQRVSQVVEREILKTSVKEAEFVTDPLTGEQVSRSELDRQMTEYESALSAEQASLQAGSDEL